MHASLFKAYDIRGTFGVDLDVGLARRLGKVLVSLYKAKRVMVGRDMRTSSPALEEALIGGLTSAGADVVVIGLCSTPMFNFALGSAGTFDLGVMVTASHNPGKYNGFKLAKGTCEPIGMGSGMEAVREGCLNEEPLPDASSIGKVSEDTGVLDRYLDRILALADLPSPMPALRVAIDAGNGMAGVTLPRLCKRLPFLDAYPLYWDLDGSFPHHEANPLKEDTLDDVKALVAQRECALGVAFDGDADRVGFVDELGQSVSGDLLTALFARLELAHEPGAHILYDLRSSWVVPEVIKEAGGTAEMCKVGHASIKRQMRETKALFAGELSMHFYFRELYYCESTELVFLLLLKELALKKMSLSELVRPLRRYTHSGEINFEVRRANELFELLRQRFATQATSWSELDGLRGEFLDPVHPEQDWWFNVRSSNTEPLVRLNVETRTTEMTKRRVDEVSAIITSFA